MVAITTVAQLVNGLVTASVSIPVGYIYWRYRPESKAFAFWTMGFVIYGIQILIRLGLSLGITDVIPAIMILVAFAFFIFGTFILVNEFRKSVTIFVLLIVCSFALYIIGFSDLALAIGIIGLYGSMAYGSYIVVHKLGANVTSFIGGWTLLFVSNFLQAAYVPQEAVDILAAMAKVIIVIGMNDQRFTTTLVRMGRERRSITRAKSTKTGYIRAVTGRSDDNTKQLDWLNHRMRQNTIEKRLTYIIVAHDTPITTDAEYLASLYGTYMVKIVPRPGNYLKDHSPLIIEMGDNHNDFEEFLSLLLRMSANTRLPSEIVIVSASNLAKKWGEENLLSYFVKKLGILKEADIIITLVLYPELHSSEVFTALKGLVSETITL